MLSKIIKNIRAKPEPVRRGITLAISLSVTGVIGFFWLISYIHYSSAILSAKPKVETPTNFLSKMGSLIGDSYANVRSSFDKDDSIFVSDENPSTTTLTASSSDTSSSVADSSTTTTTTAEYIPPTNQSTSTVSQNNASSSRSQSNSVDLQDILNTKN